MLIKIKAQSGLFLLLMAAFAGLPALATDIALSATLAISASFATSPGNVGLTLTLFMAGYAVSPLIYGPLADRYGRKPIILIATLIYTLGGLGCALSGSLPSLLAWRLFQGLGAGASRALSATIIRDLFNGSVARSKMAYVSVMGLLAPLSAPTIGSLILHFGDWRMVYWFLFVSGIVVFLLMTFGFQETLKQSTQHSISPAAILRNYRQVWKTEESMRFILITALGFSCSFSYVSGSPLIMLDIYHLTPPQYGLTFALTTCGLVTGSFVSGRLNAKHVPPALPLLIGLSVMMGCSLLLLLSSIFFTLPVALILMLVTCCTFALGLISSNAQQLALEPMAKLAGTTSAVMSTLQLGIGSVAGGLVATFYNSTVFSTFISMGVMSILAFALHYRALRREPGRYARREAALQPLCVGNSATHQEAVTERANTQQSGTQQEYRGEAAGEVEHQTRDEGRERCTGKATETLD